MKKFLHKLGIHDWNNDIVDWRKQTAKTIKGRTHQRECKICGKRQETRYVGTLSDGYEAYYWETIK